MSGRLLGAAGWHVYSHIAKGSQAAHTWLPGVSNVPTFCLPPLLASHVAPINRTCTPHSQISSASPLAVNPAWRGFSTSSSHAGPVSSLHSHEGPTQPQLQPQLDAPPVIISPQCCRVVIIGWMGSKKRYLEKYSNLWRRSADHEVLSLRTSIPMTLMRWRGVVTAGNDIDRVARMHIENPAMPTIYHIFSTGGFIHAGTMWRWMDQVDDHVLRQDLLGEVKGIIFDSAPATVNEDMASRAIASALLGTSAEQTHPLAESLTGLARSALGRYLQRPSIKQRTEEVYDAWEALAPTCPQLYLYSEGDSLVPTHDVEQYMKLQEARGVEVFSHKWPDSGHCEHYRKHPHEYAFHISQFMSHALKDW